MKTSSVAELLQSNITLQEVTLKWWVRTFRSNRFIALNYGSTIHNIQCVVDFEKTCLLYTSPSPRDRTRSRMPSSA